MNKNALKKILEHPDKEEIITKLVLDFPAKDIHEWLKAKYTNVNEAKLVIPEKNIKIFKDNYLDIYSMIRDDMGKAKLAVATSTEAELSVQNNPTYQNRMMELANKELDVRQIVSRMCTVLEIRFGQLIDNIQDDPNNINTKHERITLEYGELLGGLLEKYYKFTESPADQVIQHNVTVQMVDQHISVFHDVVREVLSQMDLESSMLFMELFSEKMSKLKAPIPDPLINTDMKVAEAKLLNETINQKLNSR